MGISDHLTCLPRNLYADQEEASRTRYGTMDWFKIGKGVQDGYILTPCLFKCLCRVHHAKCWAGWLSDIQMIPTHGRMWKGTKEPLEDGERGKWKSWFKTQHSWNNDHGIQSHHFMQTDGGKVESSNRFSFLGLQTHCGCWLQSWHQDTCFLEGKPWQT